MDFRKALTTLSPSNPVWRKGISKWIVLAGVSGGFLGYLPLAPGTWGTLLGVGLVWLLRDLNVSLYVILCVVLTGVGAWFCSVSQNIYKKKDPQRVVIDEIVGMMITMIGIPVTIGWVLVGFLLFRIFDIVKPVPANFFDQKVKSGWGVMLDDVTAGIYGSIILHLMLRAKL